MKKTNVLFGLFLLMIAPALVLGASEPVLVNSWVLSNEVINPVGYVNVSADPQYGVALWDNYIFFVTPTRTLDFNSWGYVSKIYTQDGTPFYSTTVGTSCGGTDSATTNFAGLNPTYVDGLLLYGANHQCTGGGSPIAGAWELDVSAPLFISITASLVAQLSNPVSVPIPLAKQIPLWSNGEAVELISGFKYTTINATGSYILEGAIGNEKPISDDFIDLDNHVFIDDSGGLDDFYRYEDNSFSGYTNYTLFASTPPLTGSVVDWNRNPLNPQFLLSSGRILFVGGSLYDNFQATSFIVPFTPKYYFEQANIIGIDNNKWAWSDLSNITNVTSGVGTQDINADYIWREDINKIVTYNSTTKRINIYEVPLPDFFDFAQTQANTPPQQDIEFLGVDIANNFIFKNEVVDTQGGRVYQAQALTTLGVNLEELIVEEVINFDLASDEGFTRDDSFINSRSIVTSQPPKHTGTNFGSTSLAYKVDVLSPMYIDFVRDFTASQSTQAGMNIVFTYDEENFLFDGNAELGVSVAVLDQNEREVFHLLFNRYNVNDTVDIYSVDGLAQNYLTTINLTGQDDFFRLLPNINFDNTSVEVILVTQEEIYVTTIPFTDPTAFGIKTIRFLEVGTASFFGDQMLYVDTVGFTYELNAPSYPTYDLVGLFGAGVTEIYATSIGGNTGFGEYSLYSYVTDEVIGLSNFDNLVTLNFVYDNSTPLVDQQTINQLLAEAEAGLIDGGFNTPNFIEGDLVTDTLFGLFDKWNIKTTASKFLAGLIIIILAIALGGYVGTVVNSPIVSVIGALFGGVGGLFMVTYWGLFPAWVSLTITLIVFVIIASMGRSALTGGGGS